MSTTIDEYEFAGELYHLKVKVQADHKNRDRIVIISATGPDADLPDLAAIQEHFDLLHAGLVDQYGAD
jgi:hypothetical protein